MGELHNGQMEQVLGFVFITMDVYETMGELHNGQMEQVLGFVFITMDVYLKGCV